MPIDQFSGNYRFLSNFYGSESLSHISSICLAIHYEGARYPSVENAYQAAKTTEAAARVPFERCTAVQAKRMGKDLALRPDWDDVKLDIMKELVNQKFGPEHINMQKWLFATGTEPLIEGNTWGDTYWGICRGEGENHLGRILMYIRDNMPINLCIVGGRDFNDYDLLSSKIKSTRIFQQGRIGNIVCGMAKGADLLGRRFANEHSIYVVEMPAEWDLYGKSAGFRRNEEMAAVSHAVIAFWDGKSKGTGHWKDLGPQYHCKMMWVRYGGKLVTCQMSQLDKVGANIMINIARKPISTKGIIHEISLAPSAELFSWYQNNKTRPDWWDLYVERWKAEKKDDAAYWSSIDKIKKLIAAGNVVAIACYCPGEDHCHRSLVALDINMKG